MFSRASVARAFCAIAVLRCSVVAMQLIFARADTHRPFSVAPLPQVRKRLEGGYYSKAGTAAKPAWERFHADMELIFINCKTYNQEQSDIWVIADDMLELFEQLYQADVLSG